MANHLREASAEKIVKVVARMPGVVWMRLYFSAHAIRKTAFEQP